MYNPFTLEGKTILVTGASSGIGKCTAIECSKLGAKLILTGRNEERLQKTLSSLIGDGHSIIVADLNNEGDIEMLATQCPKIDGLVSNAGISSSKPVAFYTNKELDKVFGTNAFAPMLLNRWLLKKKKINNNASVVFTSSVAAASANLGNGVYGSAKAALTAYMRYLALELAPKGIRANCVLPGMVETNLIHGGSISEEDLQNDMKKYPLGRYGKPEEIAWTIIHLLSNASSWTTGTSVVVDGGMLLIK